MKGLSMLTKVIGFNGVESYDIVLYLANIIKAIGHKKILVVDLSESRATFHCVPAPMLANKEKINHRGIDFTVNDNKSDYSNYNFVFIDFGKRIKENNRCDFLFSVTDLQVHNIANIELVAPYQYVIMRDVLKKKIQQSYIFESLEEQGFSKEKIYTLPFDKYDYINKLECQYNEVIKFNNLSGDFYDLLESILLDRLCLVKDEVRIAFKKAKKGEN